MYRIIDCATWDDPWFAELSAHGKLFFLYLITNRRSTSCGAFEVTIRHMSFESGLDSAEIEQWLQEWAPRVMWWPEHNVLWLRNFYRHQRLTNEKTKTNARRIISELPEEIRLEILKAYPELSLPEDTLSIAYPYPMHQTTASASRETTATKSSNSISSGTGRKETPPLYAKTLNGALPTLESMFQRIDQLFTPGWLAKELADAEAVVGSLSKEQLGRGLDIAVKQIERQMAAKAVRNPRPFAHKLIVDYLTEQREGNHAT